MRAFSSFYKRFLAAALCCLMLFPLAGCFGESRPANADQQILFHLGEDPATLDPQIADGFAARVAVEALYEGLVRLDENNEPYPGAAESWEVSSDGLTYTFHLREDAQWSKSIVTEDGETSSSSDPAPLTAADFVFAWQRAVDPSTGCPNADAFSVIQNGEAILQGQMSPDSLGVQAADDHTLVVTLENASGDFLNLTATAAFMPCQEAFFNWTSGRYGLEARYVCGNGPFAFSNSYSWDHEEGMALRRSSSYHGKTNPSPPLWSCTPAPKRWTSPTRWKPWPGKPWIWPLCPRTRWTTPRKRNCRSSPRTWTQCGACASTPRTSF